MRVLLAPGAVSDGDRVLTAVEVATRLAAGWAAARGDDLIATHPMCDGGSGLLEVVRSALGGEVEVALARDPWGAPLPVTWLRCGRTAYVDSTAVLGDPRGAEAARLAQSGSSAGLGELVLAAVHGGAGRVVVGVGEAGTHDGGAGALRSISGCESGASMAEVVRAAAQVLRGVEVVVAAATDRPLTGLSGAGAALADRPGIDAALAQQVERELSGLVAAIESAATRPASLLSPAESAGERRGGRRQYGGAGGGAAFALGAVGARVLPGADVVAVETGLAGAVADVDLVLTATSVLDGDALAVGVPGAVGRVAATALVPTVAVAPLVRLGRREISGTGLEATYPLIDPATPGRPSTAVALDTALSQRAGRVARTWSR